MKVLECLVAVLLIISSMIALVPIYTGDSSAQHSSHDPIVIDGDADFANQAISEGWTGIGTIDDPYIIEDYDINVTGSYGIEIRSTRVHFILRNIQIQKARGKDESAIYFFDVQNGVIENCTSTRNHMGIHLNLSSKNTIQGNSIVGDGDYGIFLSNSDTNTILENNISDNDYGIYLESSNLNDISSNSLVDCLRSIQLQDSNNNDIANNQASGGYRGLYLDYSHANQITNNVFTDNDRGITLSGSERNTLSNNSMTGGGLGITGTELAHWNTHEIPFSNVVNSKPVFYVRDRVGGEVTGDFGQIICANSTDLIISNHTINGGTSILQVGFSSKITISDNSLSSSFLSAISLERSINCLITRNSISQNDYGIELWESDNNTIENNSISKNLFAIVIFDGSGDFISGNHVSDNEYGIALSGCTKINLTKNVMINDGLDIWFEEMEHTNSHSIDESNTVNGKPLYYWKNRAGGTVPGGAGQVICANCTNVVIQNQEIYETTVGINLYYSSGCEITNNTLTDNDYGAKLSNSDGAIIHNNQLLSKNNRGISILDSQNSNVSFNIFSDNFYGMDLRYVNDSAFTNNTFMGNGKGISLFHCYRDNITGNDIDSCNWSAMEMQNSEDCTIAGNIMSSSRTGLEIFYGNKNVITANEVKNNRIDGIKLYRADNNLIRNNNLSNNTKGLNVWLSHRNGIEENLLCFNSESGIMLRQSEGNNIVSNILLLNSFTIDSSNDNTITNNSISESGFFVAAPTREPNINQIDSTNTVNGKPLYYWTNRNGGEIPSDAGQVILENCTNIRGTNLSFNQGLVGVMLRLSSHCDITDNLISNCSYGIYIHISENINLTSNSIFGNIYGVYSINDADDITAKGNIISQNRYGLYFEGSQRGSMIANNISGNEFGLHLQRSDSIIIHHNNFFTNLNHLNLSQQNNDWDNGNGKGNYWDDYQGMDTDGDGVGDTQVPHLDVDRHPLMTPADITKDYDVVEEGHGKGEEKFPVNPWIVMVEVIVLVAVILVFLIYFLRTQRRKESEPSSAWKKKRARWEKEKSKRTFSEKGFAGKKKKN